jgi:hypothetical protein
MDGTCVCRRVRACRGPRRRAPKKKKDDGGRSDPWPSHTSPPQLASSFDGPMIDGPHSRVKVPLQGASRERGLDYWTQEGNGGASVCCAEKGVRPSNPAVIEAAQRTRRRPMWRDVAPSWRRGAQPMTARDAVILFHMGWRRVWTSVTEALELGLAGLAAPCRCPSDPSNRHRLCPSPAHRQAVRGPGGGSERQ